MGIRPLTLVRVAVAGFALVVAGGCDSDPSVAASTIDVGGSFDLHDDERACSGRFVATELDHATRGRGPITAMTDGTGAGVLLEDLDDDGLVDIVLPNLAGASTVHWNLGDLTFEVEPLIEGRFRQAIAGDFTADGERDILLTTGVGPPVLLAGAGARTFERREFRTRAVAYSAAAGDIDGDGRLEVVTGSYNAELTINRDLRALTGTDVGVAVHRVVGDPSAADGIETSWLTDTAQALETVVADLDGDGRRDIIVGNDLGTPDRVWLGADGGLTASSPFDITTLSTMSLDVVDFDHDGINDVIATDMAPMAGEDLEPWLPVFADIEAARVDDVQQPRNVLQFGADDTSGLGFVDRAEELGVDATGWSWSSVAGDLDNDTDNDLYVVNGMQAVAIFEDLPDGRLVEANQVFRNDDGELTSAPEWNLGDIAGGRGMAQADLDNDGDLDIVVNNLGAAAVVHENQICDGRSVIVELRWPGSQNQDAIGAVVTVSDRNGSRSREIQSTRGYLSSPPTQAHFGLGDSDAGITIDVVWPDGETSSWDGEPGTTIHLRRTAGSTTESTVGGGE